MLSVVATRYAKALVDVVARRRDRRSIRSVALAQLRSIEASIRGVARSAQCAPLAGGIALAEAGRGGEYSGSAGTE